MLGLIIIASLLVLTTIIVSLLTAYDIGRQRTGLAADDEALQEIEHLVEKAVDQRQAAAGMCDIQQAQRDEKLRQLSELTEELRQLEEGHRNEREIGISSGLLKRSTDVQDDS
jgi:flagellar motility protein MotE (MotC chaperone)